MLSFLNPYKWLIIGGLGAGLVITILLLKIDKADLETKLTETNGLLTTEKAISDSLAIRLASVQAERDRLAKVETNTQNREVIIQTEYVEVEREVEKYSRTPVASACHLDYKWVQLYDQSIAITGRLPEGGNPSALQKGTTKDGTPIAVSEEELKQFGVVIGEALSVITRNNKLYTLLRNDYVGLLESCTGETYADQL